MSVGDPVSPFSSDSCTRSCLPLGQIYFSVKSGAGSWVSANAFAWRVGANTRHRRSYLALTFSWISKTDEVDERLLSFFFFVHLSAGRYFSCEGCV